MSRYLFAFGCGALFAVGLTLAGMEEPAVLLRAFDVRGDWDPRLYLMFLGAFAIQVPVTAWVRRRGFSLRGKPIAFTSKTQLDPRFLAGSLIFGVGWGLGGMCPGPGVTAVFTFASHATWFVAFMAIGMWLHHQLHEARARALTVPRKET